MNIKKLLMVMLLCVTLMAPSVAYAKPKDCSSYSADSCPANNCIVEDGACVKGHIGQSFCTQQQVMDALRVAGYFLFIARIFIPFIVIALGTFDMFKAVTGGDEKALTTSGKKLLIRVLIGFSIFLVPSIIHIVLSTLNDYNAITDDANVCQTCLLKPSECEDGAPSDSNIFDRDIFVQDEEEETTKPIHKPSEIQEEILVQ